MGAGGADARKGFFVGGSKVVQDLVQLVDIVAALEEGLAAEEFSQNATYRPDIDCAGLACKSGTRAEHGEWGQACSVRTGFCVALEAQHDLGRSVPPSGNVFGHVSCVLLWVHGEAPGQAKVADLELAVGVDEQVAGLEIAVEDVGRVDVLQTAQDLVDEGLEVCVGERLAGADDGSQIALHKLWAMVSTVGRGAVRGRWVPS